MKRNAFILLSILFAAPAFGQDWTWMRGAMTGSIAGIYGTQGTAASSNDPGGRHGAATWTDKAGNLWLFGGEGFSNTSVLCWLNDLWKYNKTTNQWTWMRGSNGPNASGVYGTQGTASPSNDPGAREFSICWTDTAGNFWLMGGDGYDGSGTFGKLADLWKYNPVSNQWTFVQGFSSVDQYGVYGTMGSASSLNMPGGRMGSGSWTDNNNNLWLFGGDGYASTGSSGKLNDLWKYVPSTNQWTWMKGSNTTTQASTYGTFSVAAAGNTPGGRSFPACWYYQGNMYLFGGVGLANTTLTNRLGEFWKYDPVSNNWAWIGGAAAGNQNGNYGTQGAASTLNIPGSRYSSAAWVDALGKLWLFGGNGYPGQGSPGLLNDLFRYDPVLSTWTWVKGDTTTYALSDYGTMGVSASTNKPGARMFNTWWIKTGSSLWLFGGEERNDTTFLNDHLNDLWVFDAPCNPDSVNSSTQVVCHGQSPTLSIVPPDNSTISWYSSPTSTAVLGTTATFVPSGLTASTTATTYTFYVTAATCSQSARTPVTITVSPLPQLTVTALSSLCVGVPFTLGATGAQSYTWHTGATTQTLTDSTAAGVYNATVSGTDVQGCSGQTISTFTVNPSPTISITGPSTACAGSAVTLTATGAPGYTWNNGSTGATCTLIIGPNGQISYGWAVGTDSNGCQGSSSIAITSIPSPTVTTQISASVVCKQSPATFTASGAATYSWSNGPTTSVMTHTANGYQTYTFTVTGTGTNGCSSTSTVGYIRSECIGLAEYDVALLLNIYPNPSDGKFVVEMPPKSENGTISIVNALGQLVWTKNLERDVNKFEVNLASGVYYCTLTTRDGLTYQSKLIVR